MCHLLKIEIFQRSSYGQSFRFCHRYLQVLWFKRRVFQNLPQVVVMHLLPPGGFSQAQAAVRSFALSIILQVAPGKTLIDCTLHMVMTPPLVPLCSSCSIVCVCTYICGYVAKAVCTQRVKKNVSWDLPVCRLQNVHDEFWHWIRLTPTNFLRVKTYWYWIQQSKTASSAGCINNMSCQFTT